MSSRAKNILQFIIFFGLGLGISIYLYLSKSDEEKQQYLSLLKSANFSWIPVILILSIIAHLVRSLRWKLLLNPIETKPTRVFNLFTATMIGYLVNSFIPRLGEVVKCTIVSRYEKLKFESLLGTIIIERIIDILCFAFFILLMLGFQYGTVKDFFIKKVSEGYNSQSIIKLFLLLVLIIGFIFFLNYLAKKYRQNKFITKIYNFKNGISEGLGAIKKLKNKNLFWLYTIIIWFCYIMQMYLSFKCINETANLPFGASFVALFTTTLAMIATPNGLGLMGVFMSEGLALYNIDKIAGQALGDLSYIFSFIVLIVVGLLSFLAVPIYNRKVE